MGHQQGRGRYRPPAPPSGSEHVVLSKAATYCRWFIVFFLLHQLCLCACARARACVRVCVCVAVNFNFCLSGAFLRYFIENELLRGSGVLPQYGARGEALWWKMVLDHFTGLKSLRTRN